MQYFNQVRRVFCFARCDRGAAAVEMALVFPIFLCVVLGILAFGVYFGAASSTQQIAADAARVSVAGIDPAERTSLATSYVLQNAIKYPLLLPDHVSIQANASSTNPADFVVSVTYDATALPIWGLAKLVPLPPKMITRTSVIRQGGIQ